MTSRELASSLRLIISAMHKDLRRRADSINSYSMTELATIGFLSLHESCLTTELAAMAKVKIQSMSQILKKMENAGIIKRRPSHKDKRKVYISLTSLGMKTVEKARYDKDEWLKAQIEQMLSGRERLLLEKALPVLQKLADN
ncbi:MAG TPA: MarR family transcriptional regulator [Edaphocola sp.]|nr:MarR family transcriptional regulator [Edaphocola sp.]